MSSLVLACTIKSDKPSKDKCANLLEEQDVVYLSLRLEMGNISISWEKTVDMVQPSFFSWERRRIILCIMLNIKRKTRRK